MNEKRSSGFKIIPIMENDVINSPNKREESFLSSYSDKSLDESLNE